MSLLICSGLARPNSSTTIPGFDWEGDGSNEDYAMETLIALWWVCGDNFKKNKKKQHSFIMYNIRQAIFRAVFRSLFKRTVLFMFYSAVSAPVHVNTNIKDKTTHTSRYESL